MITNVIVAIVGRGCASNGNNDSCSSVGSNDSDAMKVEAVVNTTMVITTLIAAITTMVVLWRDCDSEC